MRKIVAAMTMLCACASAAEARPYHHRHHTYHHHHHRSYAAQDQGHAWQIQSDASQGPSYAWQSQGHTRQARVHGGRPRAWCGWYMRSQVGSDPGPQYNLARSWARYGADAGGPSVGAIVVWRHHVGKIVGHENGQWIVQSGNDGHAVRTRPRSLAGAIAFRRA